jgi:hypothetical protein
MVYTVKYLAVIKRQQPDLYRQDFGEGTNNRRIIDLLLIRAESAYEAWKMELNNRGKPEYEIERDLWNEYRVIKVSVE